MTAPLLQRLIRDWPAFHERLATIAAHAQLALTGAMILALFLTPGEPPAAQVASPRGPAKPAVDTQVAQAQIAEGRTASVPAGRLERAAAQTPPANPPHVKAPTPPTPKPPPAPSTEAAPPPVDKPPAAPLAVADMPDLGTDYRKARRRLLANGFRPARVAPPECRGPEPSVDACWGALVEYPEIESCQGKNGGSCVGWWVAPDGRVLNIRTGGDQARITNHHWATSGELDELPRGWKP